MPNEGSKHPEAWLASVIEAASNCNAYPVMGREGAETPYVVFRRESRDNGELNMGDPFGSQVISTAVFGVDIYADGYLQAKDIAASVRMAIRNFSGDIGALTITRSIAEEDRDGQFVLLDGRDTPTFTIEQTYIISWLEN